MLNCKGEAKVGYDQVAHAYHELFPEQEVNWAGFSYFSVLYGLAAAAEPKVIVEIGCQYGLSTRAFLVATPQVDRQLIDTKFAPDRVVGGWAALPNYPPCIVHSIDVDPEAGAKTSSVVAAMGYADRWIFTLGRSQDVQPIECDLLYVDGDHSYAAVCSDMARHGTKVRDGGLVVLDDYHWTWPGKVRWVNERWKELDPFVIGPVAVIRVTPEKRKVFKKVYP